ncbi:hypothetical protein LTR16_011437, partial [Cryomyces antarcticus]
CARKRAPSRPPTTPMTARGPKPTDALTRRRGRSRAGRAWSSLLLLLLLLVLELLACRVLARRVRAPELPALHSEQPVSRPEPDFQSPNPVSATRTRRIRRMRSCTVWSRRRGRV